MNMAFSDSRAFDTGDVTLALRPLGWGELCARLVAAQDLRRTRAEQADRGAVVGAAPVGSFHGAAAQMLQHHGGAQGFVNPTSSINRKDNRGKPSGSRETPADPAHHAPSRRELP